MAHRWHHDRMDTTARSTVLDTTCSQWVAAGWTVETRSTHQAVLTSGDKPNHAMHAILTVFTLGVWAPVWIYQEIRCERQRVALTVQEDGTVHQSEPVNY